jgi:NhaP-type Na+/H+ or K+/H+ antiporter
MMTLDNLISVLSLCLTSVALGFALGYALGQIHVKK